jgi:hypothetical protein
MSDFSSPLPGNGGFSGTSPRPLAALSPRAADEHVFLELRRKVQESELLSSATERLLGKMRFNGRLTVVIQNGRILKSAYEEGYFRRKNDLIAG